MVQLLDSNTVYVLLGLVMCGIIIFGFLIVSILMTVPYLVDTI